MAMCSQEIISIFPNFQQNHLSDVEDKVGEIYITKKTKEKCHCYIRNIDRFLLEMV